eukprot:scaffold3366_cov365-Prasinococcus_capsulatus_cf.AAC.4
MPFRAPATRKVARSIFEIALGQLEFVEEHPHVLQRHVTALTKVWWACMRRVSKQDGPPLRVVIATAHAPERTARALVEEDPTLLF